MSTTAAIFFKNKQTGLYSGCHIDSDGYVQNGVGELLNYSYNTLANVKRLCLNKKNVHAEYLTYKGPAWAEDDTNVSVEKYRDLTYKQMKSLGKTHDYCYVFYPIKNKYQWLILKSSNSKFVTLDSYIHDKKPEWITIKENAFDKLYKQIINENSEQLPDEIGAHCASDHSIYTIGDLLANGDVTVDDINSRIQTLYDYAWVYDYLLNADASKYSGLYKNFNWEAQEKIYDFINNHDITPQDAEEFIEFCIERNFEHPLAYFFNAYLDLTTQTFQLPDKLLSSLVKNYHTWRDVDSDSLFDFIFKTQDINNEIIKIMWDESNDDYLTSKIAIYGLNKVKNLDGELQDRFNDWIDQCDDETLAKLQNWIKEL